MLQFELEGKPTPWSASRTNGKRHYSPKHEDKLQAQWQIKALHRDGPLLGPVHLDFTFYFPIPKGTSYVKRQQMLAHMILPETRPDTTNMQKFYEDCLTGIVIPDDKHATDTSSRKRYSERPRTLIRVIPLNGNQEQKLDNRLKLDEIPRG